MDDPNPKIKEFHEYLLFLNLGSDLESFGKTKNENGGTFLFLSSLPGKLDCQKYFFSSLKLMVLTWWIFIWFSFCWVDLWRRGGWKKSVYYGKFFVLWVENLGIWIKILDIALLIFGKASRFLKYLDLNWFDDF